MKTVFYLVAISASTFISTSLFIHILNPALEKKIKEFFKRRNLWLTQRFRDLFLLQVKVERFSTLTMAIPPIIGIILGYLLGNVLLGLIIGLIIGFGLPGFIISNIDKKRKRLFSQQLPDALMILSSCLKGGMSLLQAFEVLAEEMPSPISDEFGLIIRENKMGIPLEECLNRLSTRFGSAEVDLFVSSVLVARETGGDLTEVFSHLVYTIREKTRIKNQIRTLTVQGRLQGLIMSLLPFAFAGLVYTTNPGFFKIMAETQIGRFLLGLAVVLQVMGVALIRKFSRISI